MAPLKLFATRTGTLRNLALMAQGEWGILLTPHTDLSPPPLPYAFDSGGYRAFKQGVPFDSRAYERALDRVGRGALFIVAPDIVEGGLESLRLSLAWLPWCLRYAGPGRPVLIVLQDGMRPRDLISVFRAFGTRIGFFLGGSTAWKLKTMRMWGRLARRLAVYYHVGRVNTSKRIALAISAGADSVEGTSATQFAVNIPKLTYAARQLDLLGVRR